ncbi:MAG: hypothetical protein EOP32_15135 [Rhodococcus sp. (in: high G+C Gram-positive bacteria)]|nr:MAG: hypothetical protein EOP32_15135 [Rhodococcus sp. (in: high G+C Gram-positive bacteria)]
MAWILRFLSEVGVTVEVLREAGEASLAGGLMDDVTGCRHRCPAGSLRCGRHGINTGFGAAPPHGWERGNR